MSATTSAMVTTSWFQRHGHLLLAILVIAAVLIFAAGTATACVTAD